VRADLTVGADGRFSKLASWQALNDQDLAADGCCFGFAFASETDPIASLDLRFGAGQFVIFIDRFDYWQMVLCCQRRLPAIRAGWSDTAPDVSPRPCRVCRTGG